MRFILLIFFNFLYLAITAQNPVSTDYLKDDFSDLHFLREKLGDKKIVCLGEEEHRHETASQIKNRIVKYLTKELGFEVIIFESSMILDYMADELKLQGHKRLCNTNYGVWRSQSVLDFYQYIEQVNQNSIKIHQTGCDIKHDIDTRFSFYLKSNAEIISPKYAEEIFNLDTTIVGLLNNGNWQFITLLDEKQVTHYCSEYQKCIDFFESNKAKFKIEDLQFHYFMQCLRTRMHLVKFWSKSPKKQMKEMVIERDKYMSENIQFLINTLHKGKKVIIWGADTHISRTGFASAGWKNVRGMVQLLPDEMKTNMYNIGIQSMPFILYPILKTKQENPIAFYDLHTYKIRKLNKEFDAVILAKKWTSSKDFDKYRIDCKK